MSSSRGKQNSHKAKGSFSILLSVILLILVIGLAVFVYAKSQGVDLKKIDMEELISYVFFDKNSSSDKEQKSSIEIGYDWRERPAIGVLKDSIIKCTRDNLKLFDKNGRELWTKNVIIEKPFIKTNRNEAVLYDKGGKNIYVVQPKGIKWESKAGDTIINADINQDGYVSVVEDAKTFKGRVRVYDPLGIEMFNRSIAERFILSAKVSPSSEQLLITGIDISGVSSSSSIEFTDMRGNPFSARVLRENEIFPSIWYLDDDSLMALNSNTIIFFDKNRNEKWDKNFNKIYSSNILLGKYMVVGIMDEKKPGMRNHISEIRVFDVKGNQTASCQIEGEIINIETYSDIIAVNTGRELYFVNSKGKLLGKYNSKSDISKIHFFNRQEILVVSKNNLTITNFGRDN
jgi:hypothetical protein